MAVSTTSRLGVTRWSAGTDPFSRAQMDASHAALEGVVAMYSQTAAAGRPAFGKQGRIHVASDTDVLTYDNGTAWQGVKAVPTAHSHAIADLPVAGAGVSSATLLVRADDPRLSSAKPPLGHTHAIADLPVADSGEVSSTELVRADDERLGRVVPGMMMIWPVPRTVALPTGWDRATGQVVARAGTYAGVFAVYGTTWNTGGESASDFRMPNPAERFLLGSTGAAGNRPLGSYGGTAQRTILEANLPAHTHTMVHTHTINHDHPAVTSTTESADHAHYYDTGYSGGHSHTELAPAVGAGAVGGSSIYRERALATTGGDGGHSHAGWTGGINANHTHNVDVPAYSGSSGASTASATGSVGSGTPLDLMNPYAAVDFLIKL